MTRFNQPLGGNDMPRFGGPATMMRLPSVTSAKGLDVAFIGVPMDHGTSNRPVQSGELARRRRSRMASHFSVPGGISIRIAVGRRLSADRRAA